MNRPQPCRVWSTQLHVVDEFMECTAAGLSVPRLVLGPDESHAAAQTPRDGQRTPGPGRLMVDTANRCSSWNFRRTACRVAVLAASRIPRSSSAQAHTDASVRLAQWATATDHTGLRPSIALLSNRLALTSSEGGYRRVRRSRSDNSKMYCPM